MIKKILQVVLGVSVVAVIAYQSVVIINLKDDLEDYESYFYTVESTMTILEQNSEQTFQDFLESYAREVYGWGKTNRTYYSQ